MRMINKLQVVLFFTLLYSLAAFSQPKAPEGMVWKEVPALSDEFDTFDNSKWYKELWNYGEPVQMKAENAGVSDGKLWIKATLAEDENAERWFETSRIYSKTRISYPMYTECSMKAAHISAFNTFWLNRGENGGASRDEIDICENNSKPSWPNLDNWKYEMHSQYFIVVDNDTERNKGNFDNRNLSDSNALQGIPWNEAYHTIGAWWQDEHNVQFYLNGEPAGKVTSTRSFTRDLNLIWDLWTSEDFWTGGIADKVDLLDSSINTMYIDWVHTYTLEPVSATDAVVSELDDFHLFPNPVDDLLNIELGSAGNSKLLAQVYNSSGVKIKEYVLQGVTSQLSLDGLEAGVYYVKVRNHKSIIKTLSFIKK